MHKNKGFTLIEAVVVISIMGILALIILVNYHGYNKSNQRREAAQQIRSAIVEAQNMALAPKEGFKGYGVHRIIDIDTTNPSNSIITYTVFRDENLNAQYDAGEKIEKSYTVPPKNASWVISPIFGQDPPNNGDICFEAPNDQVYNYNFPFYEITIMGSDGSSPEIRIKLNTTSGQVNLQILR